MTDEGESHHAEQFPMCLRFVDQEYNIKEDFSEFGKCEQTNGESVFKEVMRFIEKNNLNIEFGVQKQVTNLYKKAVCSHNLSLAVASACKIPVVPNVLDIAEEVSQLFVTVYFYCFSAPWNLV